MGELFSSFCKLSKRCVCGNSPHTTPTEQKSVFVRSIKKNTDQELFLELAFRGYDVTKVRQNETPAEIVKIE